ncbi:MAG: FHA domain-containing protein [Pirellulales bacterium]
MSEQRIKVSWDDLRRPEVDHKLQQQANLNRAQAHYQQPPPPPPSNGTLNQASPSIWYNSLFCMTAFGLMGGLLAAIVGEVAYQAFLPDRYAEYEQLSLEFAPLYQRWELGELSDTEFENRRQSFVDRYSANPYLQIWLDPSLTEPAKEAREAALLNEDEVGQVLGALALFVVVGVCVAVALSIAEPLTTQNWTAVARNGATAVGLGVLGAVLAMAALIVLGFLMGNDPDEQIISLRQVVVRAIAWSAVGASVAVAPGILLKSKKRFVVGVAGGLLGGFIGGVLFDPVALATHSVGLSRIIGITTIGLVTGFGTGLIENAAKTGWLRVVAGLLAGKQFIIYRDPTQIGSSPQCEIYLFKDRQVSPVHAALHIAPGGFDVEDRSSASGTLVNGRPVKRSRLQHNDQIQIGGTTFVFQEKVHPRA